MAGFFVAALASFVSYTMASLTDLPLCGSPVLSYGPAKQTYPALADALTVVEQHPIAVWWSDNNPTHRSEVVALLDTCNASTVPTIVVYALPNKDCHAGYSNRGFVKSPSQYAAFIQDLADMVGNRPVIYVLEPDAVGLATGGGCGQAAGYLDNMQRASAILTTKNVHAALYVDVGYWMLQTEEKARQVAAAVRVVSTTSPPRAVRGVVLNTSNYRPVAEMAELCATLIKAGGNSDWRCVVDTSRNYKTPPTSTEWCNSKFGAIGIPPTRNTGYPGILDLFLWIKIPGESDGICTNGTAAGTLHSPDAMAGPDAAIFFPQAFRLQWNQGYFVQNKLGAPLGKDAEIVVLAQVESKHPIVLVDRNGTTTATPPTEVPASSEPALLVNQVPAAPADAGAAAEPRDASNLTWSIVGAVMAGATLFVLLVVLRRRRRQAQTAEILLSCKSSIAVNI